MLEWHNIKISASQIDTETNYAVLIKMPNSCEFKGYKFWISKKLIRSTGKFFSISYQDDFKFKLTKNRPSIEISAECMLECFETIDASINKCIDASNRKRQREHAQRNNFDILPHLKDE